MTTPLANHVNWRGLTLGLLATTPLLALCRVTGDLDWLRASLFAVSLLLGWLESGLTALGVAAQAGVILALFMALTACRDQPLLFSLLCAVAAVGVVRIGGVGARLRTLAAFSFIPAVYLAFDVAGARHGNALSGATATLPALASSLALVLIVMAVTRWRHETDCGLRPVFVAGGWGPARPHAAGMLAAGLAVGAVAALSLCLPLESGQWAIWSALSIVTAEAGLEGRKLRDRALGALVGVPIGFALSRILPHGRLFQEIAALLAMLTLVTMRHYVAGIMLRWGLVACAAALSGGSMLAASERILDVIAGGAAGLGFVLLSRVLIRVRVSRRSFGCQGRPEC